MLIKAVTMDEIIQGAYKSLAAQWLASQAWGE